MGLEAVLDQDLVIWTRVGVLVVVPGVHFDVWPKYYSFSLMIGHFLSLVLEYLLLFDIKSSFRSDR
jgi:hypothetical protein